MEYVKLFIAAAGIPSAIVGLIIWWFKRWIEQRDAEKERLELEREANRERREKNIENLVMLTIKSCDSIKILSEATARAVQRIPDAHCNGDMTTALKRASEIEQEEKEFLTKQGIKHIFED